MARTFRTENQFVMWFGLLIPWLLGHALLIYWAYLAVKEFA